MEAELIISNITTIIKGNVNPLTRTKDIVLRNVRV